MKSTPFATITETARLTGVSTYLLRKRCRERSIPCLPLGDDPERPTKYLVDVEGLVAQLRAEAAQGVTVAPLLERDDDGVLHE